MISMVNYLRQLRIDGEFNQSKFTYYFRRLRIHIQGEPKEINYRIIVARFIDQSIKNS